MKRMLALLLTLTLALGLLAGCGTTVVVAVPPPPPAAANPPPQPGDAPCHRPRRCPRQDRPGPSHLCVQQ